MTPPPTIKILSDQNELQFMETITPIGTKTKFFMYKYSKSKTKKNQLLGLTEPELLSLIKTNTP